MEGRMADFGLSGKMTAIPGQGDALAAHLLEAATALEGERSCHLYLVARDTEDPDGVWVVEVWDDADAHRASLEFDAVRDLIGRARPIIASISRQATFRPIGGKGLPS
jgi:quinol monooxygenase YgiN